MEDQHDASIKVKLFLGNRYGYYKKLLTGKGSIEN